MYYLPAHLTQIDGLVDYRDLMAQRLARRAEDREVPGSSPTQD